MSDRQEESFTCPYCGAECASDARKCPDCGATVAPARATSASKETRSCPMCGESILAVAKKCRYCGEGLAPRAEAAPVAVAQASGAGPDLQAPRAPDLRVGKGMLLFGVALFLLNVLQHASPTALEAGAVVLVAAPAMSMVATSVAAGRGSKRGYWSFYVASIFLLALGKSLIQMIQQGH